MYKRPGMSQVLAIDLLGLAYDLEQRASLSESQTDQRAMIAAAAVLRVMHRYLHG